MDDTPNKNDFMGLLETLDTEGKAEVERLISYFYCPGFLASACSDKPSSERPQAETGTSPKAFPDQ